MEGEESYMRSFLMTDDAAYLIDLFEIQKDALIEEMYDKRIRREKFDKFSYSSWAIQETLMAINECDSYISVATISHILRIQADDYERWYNRNPQRNERYKHALWTIKYLINFTEGYMYE